MSRVYLQVSLPKIALGMPLEISRRELDFMLAQNLSSRGKKSVDDIRRLHDVENAVRWFQHRQMFDQGTIPVNEYQIALIEEDRDALPPLVFEFMNSSPDPVERKSRSQNLLFLYTKSFFGVDDEDETIGFRKRRTLHPTVLKIYEIEHAFRVIFGYFRAEQEEKGLRARAFSDGTGAHETSRSAEYLREAERAFGFSVLAREEWPDAYVPLYDIWHDLKEHPAELDTACAEWKFGMYESLLARRTMKALFRSFRLDEILVYCAQYDLIEAENMKKNVSHGALVDRISRIREKE